MPVTSELLTQYLLAGIIIGILYGLMGMGITFIYSIMKMINWAMGEFYMIGSYLQFIILAYFIGVQFWYVGIPIVMLVVFVLGVIVQRLLIRPMFAGGIERRDEYASIVTICLMMMLRSLAVALGGPHYRTPGTYLPGRVTLGPLIVSGDRFVAFVGAILIMFLFYIILKKTWMGMALRAAAQNRVGIQTTGVNLLQLDQVAFGIGIAMAAATGALLAPTFLVYPTNGAVTTMKGFEIVVIGGLGSIPGAAIAGLLLGIVEGLGAVFVAPGLQNAYGFVMLLAILVLRPHGLLGEKERAA